MPFQHCAFVVVLCLLTVAAMQSCTGKKRSTLTEAEEVESAPPGYTEKIDSTPDLLQTHPDGGFPGGGGALCGPVSASNSIMWLAEHGFEALLPKGVEGERAHFELVKRLCSKQYMNSSLKGGTGPMGMLRGTKKYVHDAGCEYERLECQSWRRHQEEFATGVSVPRLDWIREGIHGNGCVWLNAGWYTYDSEKDDYERIGGHWVTLVGYGVGEDGQANPDVLIIHDPAPRAGAEFANEYVVVERIGSGRLTGKADGLPRSAEGYYKLGGGMHVKARADVAILDAAIVLKMPD